MTFSGLHVLLTNILNISGIKFHVYLSCRGHLFIERLVVRLRYTTAVRYKICTLENLGERKRRKILYKDRIHLSTLLGTSVHLILCAVYHAVEQFIKSFRNKSKAFFKYQNGENCEPCDFNSNMECSCQMGWFEHKKKKKKLLMSWDFHT